MTTDDYVREMYLLLQSIADYIHQIFYGYPGTVFSFIVCLLLINTFINFVRFIRSK